MLWLEMQRWKKGRIKKQKESEKKIICWDFPVVQWLRLHIPNAGGHRFNSLLGN